MTSSRDVLGIFIFSSGLSAQTAIINGQAKGQPNELVRIIVYADQFSRLQKTIASTYTDENGAFSFNIEIDETTFASFALGLKKAEFYLKPGATYTFTVPLDTITQTGSIFDEVPLQFTYQANDEGLSDALTALNVENNRFMYEFADKIYRGRDKSPVVLLNGSLIPQEAGSVFLSFQFGISVYS